MNLFRGELARAASRRLVRIFLMLSIIGVAVTGVVAFARTASANDALITAKIRAYHVQEDAQRKSLLACLNRQEQSGVDQKCQDRRPPSVHDPRFDRNRLRNILTGTGGIVALAAWVLGASLVGAELQSRSITTTLTFAPSRLKVFCAKAMAALLVVAGWAAATLVLLLLALLPSVVAHGTPGLSPGNVTIAATLLRGLGLASITAMMGFSLAFLGRTTAAALGVGFGYIIVIEQILGNSLAGWRRWLLLGNAIVFMTGSGNNVSVGGRGMIGATVFLVAVAATLLVASGTVFRTRDVA